VTLPTSPTGGANAPTLAPSEPRASIAVVPAVLLVACLVTFIQSFLPLKLAFIGLFLLMAFVSIVIRRRVVLYPRLVAFYVVFGVAAMVWAVIGLLQPGNFMQGNLEALRVYGAWSLAFIVLFTLLRSEASPGAIHAAFVTAGILIAIINFVGLADIYAGWHLISDDVRKALDQYIGFHEGYIQITSQNIGALLVIVPYLIAIQLRADARGARSGFMRVSLVLSLILAVASGRRALWVVIALAPCTILLLALFTNSVGLIRRRVRRTLVIYTVVIALVPIVAPVMPASIQELSAVRRVRQAFSSEDARTIQRPYLLAAFARSPVLGSGFGAYAGYLRSHERPWTYELTYYKLLFSLGLVGFAVVGTLFGVYFLFVLRILQHFKQGSAVPFAMLVGWCSLLIGAYSNPYFGSFDYLFLLGLLPYLSTFGAGFQRPAPPQPGAG